MKSFKWIATALILTLLALPGAALAQGGAAGDQYTEQPAPTATGDDGGGVDGSAGGTGGSSSSGGTATGSGSGSGPLGSDTTDEFGKGGSDGKAAAGIAQSTAPDSDALNSAAAEAQAGTPSSSTGVFDAPGDSSSSDDGMGIWLPIILAVVLLGGLGYAWMRRRGDSGTPSGGSSASTGSLRDRFRSSLPGRG